MASSSSPSTGSHQSTFDSGNMTATGNSLSVASDAAAPAAAMLAGTGGPLDGPETIPIYPMPVYLKFSPGGLSFSSSTFATDESSGTVPLIETASLENCSSSDSYMYALADYTKLFLHNVSSPGTPGSASSLGGGGLSSPRSNRPDRPAATPSSSSLNPSMASAGHATSAILNCENPDALVYQARIADDKLCSYIKLFANGIASGRPSPTYLPSLSVLANAVFGRLTGVPPQAAKAWADAMVLQYSDDSEDNEWPKSEEDVVNALPASPIDTFGQTTVALLKRLLDEGHAKEDIESGGKDSSRKLFRPRPCGYVFKRGDIAWNCRTCQTDSTCVICDSCFRDSNHDGHEVYFHRTTPGGCCDCGDAEAWKVDGCCDHHRPQVDDDVDVAASASEDPEEAVRMAIRGRKDGIEVLMSPPTKLPPKLASALGVVIGAAVNCLVQAADGAGVGADPVQWKFRWADEAAKIWNGAQLSEDYHKMRDNLATSPPSYTWTTPLDFMADSPLQCKSFPSNYTLQLRLHNDDVHTFEEVIDALHDPRHSRRNNQSSDDSQTQSLVTQRDAANDMTHHVDADGQVTVKSYSSIPSAMQGFKRLKSSGLHCAVVSTAQVDMEQRARALSSWLADISSAHPATAVLVVDALLQVNVTHDLAGVAVWQEARSIPAWVALGEKDEVRACRRRFQCFPPHIASSYLTSEEAELLHDAAMEVNAKSFVELTATDPLFYASVPYRLPSEKYRKSPHALWGTLPSLYTDPIPSAKRHPLLKLLVSGQWNVEALSTANALSQTIYVIDTDLRKQQEADRITSSVFPHKLPGLCMISGVGMVRVSEVSKIRPIVPNPMQFRHLLATSSFRAPISPVILLLLLDPYPTKQLRGAIHSLFLSLLTDARFKCRFAAALGVAYRPLSTLFCAGVGTEADSPLGFTVQIFTAGSLVRALGNATAVEKLLIPDDEQTSTRQESSIGVFTVPISLTVVRSIHTNLLGATKEVRMILKSTASGNDNDGHENTESANESLVPALTYVAGEHPLLTLLPAAPDDGFLDSRSTRHKRLPHLLRDLEYVIETPGTAMRLLLSNQYPAYEGISISSRGEEILSFCTVWARLLRLAQGMDPQKRKISGGHVEYEQSRWLEAFGLSLNFAGTRDALAESPTNSSSIALAPVSEDGSHLVCIREAMGNIMASLLREMKHWLYKEGMLETGLPVPPGGSNGANDLSQAEALQRSTLHVAASQLGASSPVEGQPSPTNVSTVALSCATTVKMTETQLDLIESALRLEGAQRQYNTSGFMREGASLAVGGSSQTSGAVMGDWLRVPHSPLAGDSLSFHLPLHRALAKTVRSLCGVVVPESIRNEQPHAWWKLPVLDIATNSMDPRAVQHPLVPLIRPILKSSNCRVVWSAGPDCTQQEAQRRRARSRTVSANIAVAKIIHSLADHPIRCLAAAQQIERHLWARNGSSVAGMALNYSNAPLCRSFRDLDLTLVQLSASGMSVGLGARRVFSLLISRFSMDGYLCDPERRSTPGSNGNGSYTSNLGAWVNPPRLQDPDHATVLSESLFATLCVLVTELPAPPPISSSDETWLRQSIRRELIHALAAEPRSHSSAMTAASCAVGRRDESDGSAGTSGGGGLFRDVFAQVLKEVGKQKSQGSRSASGPASFQLSPSCCDEYDPTFFHLRRQEHQHAMDIIASLRKQKLTTERDKTPGSEGYCFPLVCQPPKAHPRFLPCRLMLHIPPMDAAVRRSLLFALLGGSWLPPPDPVKKSDKMNELASPASAEAALGISVSTEAVIGDVPVMTLSRRAIQAGGPCGNPFPKRGSSFTEGDSGPLFSSEVVASSSISFLEVLQLLTLQVHTLEECASLHRLQPDLDEEAKSLSAGLSINSYLGRLVHVPDSLANVWALRPYPDGPLKSKGSGEERGSILGLLIALYEHRADHGRSPIGSQDEAADGHGGARSLTATGLKWLLRFVNALVDGAPSVAAAVKSATSGRPIKSPSSPRMTSSEAGTSTIWTIDDKVRVTITGMLANLPDLWPNPVDESMERESSASKAKKQKGKAAQQRMLEMMRKKQSAFIESMGSPESGEDRKDKEPEQEEDLCIICRCDDTDGENNGPLGFLGHVQRSRVAQLRACREAISKGNRGVDNQSVFQRYRVVGHMGCQVRESEAMDSQPVFCLPRGSIVTVLRSTVCDKYDILSRRVLVKHVSEENGRITEGWASVQSSQGYVILSPLVSLCYENTRWGSTRPIIRQCGHAAHMKCVETHTLSLHQRAAGEQPYDGRFAANIDDGEFLCPLCKQLSNILIPRDGCAFASESKPIAAPKTQKPVSRSSNPKTRVQVLLTRGSYLGKRELDEYSEIGHKALADFGSHLLQAMAVPWERSSGSRKRKHRRWHPAIRKWDYEEEDNDDISSGSPTTVKNTLRLLRQQHIAWAAVGHSAAASEAAVRGVEVVLPFGSFSKTDEPWPGYKLENEKHPNVLELTRILTAAAGLLQVLIFEMAVQLGGNDPASFDGRKASSVCTCIADVLCGNSWALEMRAVARDNINVMERKHLLLWSQITALVSSVPCHVARDGMLSQRHEARAAAAEMWISRGAGTKHDVNGEPPVPLAIKQLFSVTTPRPPDMERNWGTLAPTSNADHASKTPFRPAIATAFLYIPLLAWDLNTLAGAVFSSILINRAHDSLNCEDILNCGRILLVGRMIQALVTPYGFDSLDDTEIEEEDDEGRWEPAELRKEALSLAKLFMYCRDRIHFASMELDCGLQNSASDVSLPTNLFGKVSRSIIPYARSIILMMRACYAAVKHRNRKKSENAGETEESDATSASFRILKFVISGRETMTTNDGMFILREIKAPLPSTIIDENGDWWRLVNDWLTAAIALERHHGSRGKSMLGDILSPSGPSQEINDKINMTVDDSTAVEGDAMNLRPKNPKSVKTEFSASDSLATSNNDRRFEESQNAVQLRRRFFGDNIEEESEDELVEDVEMEEAVEMVDFAEEVAARIDDEADGNTNADGEDSADEPSTSGSDEGENGTALLFAGVGQSPIISYQPSLLAQQSIGPGKQGSMFEAIAASSVMADFSHLGLAHRKDSPTFSLIRLPKSFVELYGIVNKVKGREESTTLDEADDVGNSETAICLLTGTVMRSGSNRRSFGRPQRPPGACTLHARKNGSGIGVFFLVQKCTVLLMHNNKSAYSASIYVDEHGEEDPGLRRGRPLFLNDSRYQALEKLWRQQGIPREVAQIRSTSDRVIRDNWY